jgi:hypothetical protein
MTITTRLDAPRPHTTPPAEAGPPERVRAWQLTARRLVRAANVLHEAHPEARSREPQYASLLPALVLYGLAAENLVKGLLAAQGGGREDDPRLKSHHLAWLFEQARVPLSDKEAGIVDRLQWFLEKGRYPAGVEPGQELGGEVARLLRLLTRLEDALATAAPSELLAPASLFELGRGDGPHRPGGGSRMDADPAREEPEGGSPPVRA